MSTLREAAEKALVALEYMHTEKVDYMIRNNLGDPLREDAARLAVPAIEALRAELAKPDAPMVQDGWQLVPVEPTEAMWSAGRDPVMFRELKHYRPASLPVPAWQRNPDGTVEKDTSKGTTAVHVWRAMLAAAPGAPTARPALECERCGLAPKEHGATHWCDNQSFRPAPTSATVSEPWRKAVMEAYGHLWHVNNEPAAPIPMRSPEKAAYEARKCLRELLTKEERGEAINAVGQLIGRGITATKGDNHA